MTIQTVNKYFRAMPPADPDSELEYLQQEFAKLEVVVSLLVLAVEQLQTQAKLVTYTPLT
jgi:hypothetical protein